MGLLAAACLDRAGMNPVRAEIEAAERPIV
jgi:hypothetical protein